MAKTAKTKKRAPSQGRASAMVVRLILTTVALGVILLVAAYLFACTDGFRSMVESRLASSLGLPLEIGESRVLLSGELEFGDIHTTNRVEDGVAGVRIERATIGIHWLSLLGGSLQDAIRYIQADGWQVNFAPDAEGRMQPAPLAGASDWLGQWGGLALPGTDEPARQQTANRTGAPKVPARPSDPDPSLDRWKQTRFLLSRGDIEWWDAAGNVVVSVHAIDFFLTPLQLPTRPAAHYHAKVKSAVLPGDQRVRDMDLELLRTGETYLVLNLEAVRQTGGGAARLPSTRAQPDPPPVTPSPPPAPPREEAVDPPAPAGEDLQQYIRGELEEALRGDR